MADVVGFGEFGSTVKAFPLGVKPKSDILPTPDVIRAYEHPAAPATINPTAKLVFVQPDPFAGAASDVLQDYVPDPYAVHSIESLLANTDDAVALASRGAASRPAGIVVKPNTYATARVVKASGEVVSVLNSNNTGPKTDYVNKSVSRWTDWLLVAVQESRAEKTQIVETFGGTYIYAFGQRPRMLSFSGILVNTADYNWRATFWENWEQHFRATQLVKNDARMYISFDDILVEGYPLEAQAQQSANDPHALNFSFSFFVTNYINMTVQQGFKREQGYSLNYVTPGYDIVKGNDGKVVDPTLVDDRISIVRYLGSGGIFDAVEGLEQTLLEKGQNPMLARLARDSLYGALDLAARGIYDPAVAKQMATGSNLVASGEAQLQSAQAVAVAAAERSANIRPGEINKLRGWLSVYGGKLLDQMADSKLLHPGQRTLTKALASAFTDPAGNVKNVGKLSGWNSSPVPTI